MIASADRIDDGAAMAACIDAVCADLLAAEAELSALDRAIGDGDHGSNVARAARALLDNMDALAAMPVGGALERAGTIVVMSVGGASGPLYGSLLMAMGKAWREPRDIATIAGAFAEGVVAVERRGRSTRGEKTMLDVLVPAAEALGGGGPAAMLAAADAGVEATRPLRATKGRAAFVGERSIGHVDPGAASARIALHAAVRALAAREGRPA
ncbi:MAG: dihydroxyacetone kinase subunit DhaL [Sphingomonas sp.]